MIDEGPMAQTEVLSVLLEQWGDHTDQSLCDWLKTQARGSVRMIGVGTQGIAFELDDGSVVKITDTQTEAEIAEMVCGGGWTAFPKIRCVRPIPSAPVSLYAIFREGVKDVLPRHAAPLRDLVDEALEKFMETGSAVNEPMARLARMSSCTHRDLINLLDEIARFREATGICLMDLNCDNLGRTGSGRLVVRDFGLSQKRVSDFEMASVTVRIDHERQSEEDGRTRMPIGGTSIPRLLYHGSCREIGRFGHLRAPDMAGIYFTPSFDEAASIALDSCMEEEDEPTVMTAQVDIRNPFVMSGTDSQVISPGRRDELISLGYDGVIGTAEDIPFEYVAFDPRQVRIVSVKQVAEPKANPLPVTALMR